MGIDGTFLPRSCKLALALLHPEVLFSRVARHLACVAFCEFKVGIHRLNRLVLTNLYCQRILANAIFYCYKYSSPRVVYLSSSLKEAFLARHAIFPGNEMYKKIMAPRDTYLQTSRVLFSILSSKNSILKFKMK